VTMEAAGTWLAAATVFGAIAGAMTRRHTMNALAAFTGTLEGLKEGNQQKFEQQSKMWEQENKQAYQNWKMANDAYQKILDDRKLDMDTKSFMIQQKAAEVRDDAMAQQAATKDYITMAQLQDKRREQIEKAQQSYQVMQARIDYQRDRLAQTDRRLDMYSPEGLAQRQLATAEPRALAADLNKLTVMRSAVTTFENTAKKNIDKLIQLAQEVDQSGVPFIERFLRGGEAAVGQQAAKNFQTQLAVVRPEIGRILANPTLGGVLSDSARAEVHDIFSQGDSAANVYGVAQVLRDDFANRAQSLDDEIASVNSQIANRRAGQPSTAPPANQPWQPRAPQQNQPKPLNGSAPPQIGEVRKGWRFKGGDPADKNSWERVGNGA
jgi:hypothetical protein